MNLLKTDIESRILEIKRSATLNYDGAVELMSRYESLYQNFNYSIGHIWCCGNNEDNINGSNRVELTDTPRHSHPNTKAESFTMPPTTSNPGGEMIGVFNVGVNNTITS